MNFALISLLKSNLLKVSYILFSIKNEIPLIINTLIVNNFKTQFIFFITFIFTGLYLYLLVVKTFTGDNIKLRLYLVIGWGKW